VCATDETREYDLVVSPAATRDLRQLAKSLLPGQFQSIDKRISALARDPRPVGCEKLSGGKEDIYRIRDGDYRILYAVCDESRRVEIARVRDRKGVYRH